MYATPLVELIVLIILLTEKQKGCYFLPELSADAIRGARGETKDGQEDGRHGCDRNAVLVREIRPKGQMQALGPRVWDSLMLEIIEFGLGQAQHNTCRRNKRQRNYMRFC